MVKNENDSLNDEELDKSEEKLEDKTIQNPSADSSEKLDNDLDSTVDDPALKSSPPPESAESTEISIDNVDIKDKSPAPNVDIIEPEEPAVDKPIIPQPKAIKDNTEIKSEVVKSDIENKLDSVEDEKPTDQSPPPDNTSENQPDKESVLEKEESSDSITDEIDVKAKESHADESDADSSESHHEEEAHLDYSSYSKKQMVQVLESLLKEDDFSQVGRILKEIKKPYDKLTNTERKEAYSRYLADGGEKDGFEYRPDELDQRFNLAYNKLRERKNQYYNSLEKQKDTNLNTKLGILEKLRELVDSEETGASIKALKELQVQWKEVGVIPSSQVKSLWANYNALLDRFYDQRSIYFELKELDRKKNFDLKIDLCEKAEQLSEQDNIRDAIKQLNELHEEFKHIGPVPKDDQEKVWERFKSASDKVYSRRKEFYDKLKDEFKLNEVAKEALVEKVIPFADFNSERISDWNSKTKEIIAVQKEWETIGSLPKEKAKEINKKFWTSFKSFFNKKGQFFKKIEEERRVNLKLKQELVEKAEALKDSDDFRKTSEELKILQKEWKDIGPVPEKFRNEVFVQFKKACDHFFDRRRANSGKLEEEYEENLKKKQVICEELEKMLLDDKIDIEQLKSIEKEWSQIGFVPKASIKSIQKRYTNAVGKIVDKVDIPETEKHKMRFSAQFGNVNYGPGAEKFIHKKEGALRRQITTLENDINLWKNNIDFFASSKNADKLKKEFQVKIDQALAQLKSLKEQLKVISNI